MLLKSCRPAQITSVPKGCHCSFDLSRDVSFLIIFKLQRATMQGLTKFDRMAYLFKLHNGLRSPSRVQGKNIIWCIDFLLFLNISSCSNDLLIMESLQILQIPRSIINVAKMKSMHQDEKWRDNLGWTDIIETNLRSNFFYFLCLVDRT